MVDFNKTGNGFIVAFLTDANDPNLLQIPAGNWDFEIYASMSSNGGTPELYAELYKYDGTTFTLIATSSHEILYDGVNLNLYSFATAVPQTSLTVTDRLAIKLYADNSGGKTTTIHTQDSHLCQVITTFSTGLTALNGLTAQVQYFGTGTSGSDFNIVSSVDTHTFNIPSASATNRGLITTGTQTIAGAKTITGTTTFTGGPILSDTNLTYANSGYTLVLQSPTLSVNRTVTLPNGTGTLALTSDLSSYVPYTGATGDVNLGYNSLKGLDLFILKNAANGAGGLNFQLSTVGTTNYALNNQEYFSLYTLGTYYFGGTWNVGGITKTFLFYSNNIPNNSTRYIGFPSIDGTLAVTSQLTGGTVTSVGLSAPTGFSVTGSPVTTSGTLALTFASGYSLPTNVKQSNWDDAYTWVAAFPTQTGNSGKFLTTDGSTLSWAANPLGTVTSVAMTVPTGLSIAGSPITTSGTLAVTLASGYVIPTQTTLDGKVPYSGATGNVTLGAYSLTATGIVVSKSSGIATISFPIPSGGNDPAFIQHEETTSDTGIMRFSVSDNDGTLDYFVFGNTSGVSLGFVERFKITANGIVTIGTWQGTAIADAYISSAATWNAKQNAITLTTTGTSGAATFVGATLNIPNYGSALTGYVPYTGATGAVNLGANAFTANTIIINKTTGNSQIYFQNNGASDWDLGTQVGDATQNFALYNRGTSTQAFYINKSNNNAFFLSSVTITSSVTASSLVKSGGTSSQFLKADGSVDSSTYLTTSSASSTYVPYTGASASLDLGVYSLTATGITVSKTSGKATILFPVASGGNDVGFIQHDESTVDLGIMRFSVGDNDLTNDYFVFGNTQTGTFLERFKILATGVVTIGTWNGTAITDTYIASAATWNAKQGAITLTTTGTSGAATFSSNTLNIPNYGSALSSYVPYTGATTDVNLGTRALSAGNILGTTLSASQTSNSQASLVVSNAGTFRIADFNNSGALVAYITNSGSIYGSSFVKSGGSSSQFLKADGSVDSTSYLPLSGGTLTGNIYIQSTGNPTQLLVKGTNSEFWVDSAYGGGTARSFVNRNTTSNQATLMFTTGVVITNGTAWSGGGVDFSMGTTNDASGNFYIGAGDIFSSSNRAITITSTKSIGIGTSTINGGSKLQVDSANGTAYTSNSQLRVSSGGVNNNRAQILFSDNALSDGKISYYPASSTNAYFSISARTTENDFIINGLGNVGIGISPSYNLDVSGGSSNAYIRAITSGSANWATLLLQNGDGTWHITNDDTGKFNIGTTGDPSGNQKLTIASGGNVLINNTTDNGNRLQVSGTAKFSGQIQSDLNNFRSSSGTQAGASTTGDIFRFLSPTGSINNGCYSAIFYIWVQDNNTGANAYSATIAVQTTSNGQTDASFNTLVSRVRGINPVSSVNLISDGGGGAAKISLTTSANATSGVTYQCSAIGIF
jgi:hypothetical protein